MGARKDLNADQTEFWNSDAGGQWVRHQAMLDASMAGILEALIDSFQPRPDEKVIDIGCGTGASCLRMADCVGAGGQVLGADISDLLLGHAHKRAEMAGANNISFLRCDAQDHAFMPRAFDGMVSRFGMMFFADPVAAFANIGRAIRIGGRMVFIAWGPMADNPWFALPRDAAIRRLGAPPPADLNAPGPMAFHDRDRVVGMMREAGLRDAQAEAILVDLTPPGTASEVAVFASRVGPVSRIMRHFDGSPEDAQAIEADVGSALAAFHTDQGVKVPARLNLYSARAG